MLRSLRRLGRGRWRLLCSPSSPLALAFVHFTAKPPEPPLRSFSFTPKGVPNLAGVRRAAISPDGRHIVYVAENKLWVRALASEQARTLEGTDGAEGPFWSPDSTQIGFASGGALKKVPLSGGIPLTLTKLGGRFRGGACSPDGRIILVSMVNQGLAEVPSGGGALKVVAPPLRGGTYYSPFFLPSSNRKRLVVAGKGSLTSQTLDLVDLATGKSETLRAPGAYPAWSPAGYVLYQTGAQMPGIWALKLSPTTGKVEGEPVSVLNAGSEFSTSPDGTLLWVDAEIARRRQLTWRDRSGKKLVDPGLPSANFFTSVAVSPDGTQAAYAAADEQGNQDISVADLVRGFRTRLTFNPEIDVFPVWSPTGQEITFMSGRQGNLDVFVQAASGSAEPRPAVVSPYGDTQRPGRRMG